MLFSCAFEVGRIRGDGLMKRVGYSIQHRARHGDTSQGYLTGKCPEKFIAVAYHDVLRGHARGNSPLMAIAPLATSSLRGCPSRGADSEKVRVALSVAEPATADLTSTSSLL
jgi:hypothetical protein